MDRYEFGRMGENAAAAYMENLGYEIVGRNVRVGHSEFDIICSDGKYIVFVEVKTRTQDPRSRSKFGPPRRAVNRDKQEVLIRGVLQYVREHELKGKLHPRIDVVEVYADASPMFVIREIKYFRNAVKRRSPQYGPV